MEDVKDTKRQSKEEANTIDECERGKHGRKDRVKDRVNKQEYSLHRDEKIVNNKEVR